MALQKSLTSFSHTRIPEEASQDWWGSLRMPRQPASTIILALPSQCPAFVLKVTYSPRWWMELQLFMAREGEGRREEGHKWSTLVDSTHFSWSSWKGPQKSTYCLSRTWSHDQPSLKRKLGNIIFVLDDLMFQIKWESASKGKNRNNMAIG